MSSKKGLTKKNNDNKENTNKATDKKELESNKSGSRKADCKKSEGENESEPKVVEDEQEQEQEEEQEENNQDNSDKKKSDQNIIISKQMKNPKETVGDKKGIKPKKNVNSLPDRAYLDQTVIPIVLKGLSILAKERPENPVKYLGEFLINHANDNSE